jgi:putative restriction endonuclease
MVMNEEAEEDARKKGRSARFAAEVVSRYRFTCALTGLCCLTTDGTTIVDAAHIEPWAENGNDDIQNGLALCKNAHWMFDEGLWSVQADGRVAAGALQVHGERAGVVKAGAEGGRLLDSPTG